MEYEDKTLTCIGTATTPCTKSFIWTASEQKFFSEKKFFAPKRCRVCAQLRRKEHKAKEIQDGNHF